MSCYLRAPAGELAAAVAICPACGVGLCFEHRSKQPAGPDGASIGCRHPRLGDEVSRVAVLVPETHKSSRQPHMTKGARA